MRLFEGKDGNRMVVRNDVSTAIAYAGRSKQGTMWYIHNMKVNRHGEPKWAVVARVSGRLPEDQQHNIVRAILKELANERN